MEGWKCPVCSRGVRPDKVACDHGGAAAFDGIDWTNIKVGSPTRPHEWRWGTPWPGTTCGSAGTVSDPNVMLWN